MTTYKRQSINYRKIYEQHYGSIPVDADGRTYEVHHIDGDHSNNDPANLKAVSMQEHYDIHYAQGDYYACYLMIIQRIDKSPEELSMLASMNNHKRAKAGTHPWQANEHRNYLSEKNKKKWEELGDYHPALVATKRKVEDGSHHLLAIGKDHPKYDHSIYSFKHKITGEIISMTRQQFCKTYSISGISELINGIRKSVKGWEIIKNDPVTIE